MSGPRLLPARALGAAKLALFPLLLGQALQVRRKALELPEAAGARRGEARPAIDRQNDRHSEGPALRLLVVGDSSAAGVGVARQRDALAATVSARLADALGCAVRWQLVARTGNTTQELLAQLRDTELAPADVLLSAVGVNDVVRQVPVARSLAQLRQLHAELRERTGLRYWLHSGLPPMHQFPLLPSPLRWLLGSQAELLNQALQAELGDQHDRALRRIPPALRCDAGSGLMAEDGFHPGAGGYALWGEALAEFLARRWPRVQRRG